MNAHPVCRKKSQSYVVLDLKNNNEIYYSEK